MRIMWTVFVTFPEVADKIHRKSEYACTWARALADKIRHRDDIKLAIVSVADEVEIKKFTVDNIDFYFLPNRKDIMRTGGGDKAQQAWKHVLDDFMPDVIHIHGSETLVPYELVKMKPNVPMFVTLQGILSNYYKDEYAAIKMSDILKTTTLRDAVRHSGIIMDKKKIQQKSLLEQDMLKGVPYLGGRTIWDKVSSLSINPNATYIYAPELIRPEFYAAKRWDIAKVQRHRIFMHQGFKPIKGLHILLEAMVQLRKKYPDVELFMSGTNVMKNSTVKEKLLQPGYIKYLFQLIDKYELKECIHFTGVLNAEQIVDELYKSNVMVLPSAIENSPNSLCEAQLVGIPCVASYVGGVPEMLDHGKEGFLYTFNEPLMLAEYISQIFESDETAERFSKYAYDKIRVRQGEQFVIDKTIDNYRWIIEDYRK
mgnify:CR=1 FL=1